MNQPDRARYFRQLHDRRPLILPNAWDAGSARVIEAAGAAAIATTSAGISWSFGRTDGQKLRREDMIQAVRNIVDAVDIPVNADIESGYGNGSSADVAETVKGETGSKGFLTNPLQNVGVGRIGVPQILSVDTPVRIQFFGEPQSNLCPRLAFDLESYPSHHVLAHIENECATRQGGHILWR